MTMNEKTRLALQKRAKIELARKNFADFVAYTFPKFAWNWHHEVLAHELDQAAKFKRTHRKVIIVTPPRHGKSELVSRRLPAFMLGKYPEMETIQWCYSGDLAEKMGRDCKKILESPEFLEVFPEFEFGEKRTHSEMSTKQGGNYKTSGVDGGVTGRGANLVVVDDPFKNREEAESQSRRDKVWESFKDDLMTRIEYPYSVVVTMTRWHPDDLVGRLLKKEPGEWRVIHMPLIADYEQWDEPYPEWDPREPGDPLWPGVRLKGRIEGDEEFDLPTEEELNEEIKREFVVNMKSNPHGTNSLQQGRPTNKEGNLFKADWMLRYSSPPETMEPYCASVVLSIDANFKKTNTGSAAALVVMGQRSDGKICVLDAKWDRWSWVQLKKEAKKMAKKWPRATVVIEDKANGSALISELRDAGMVVVDYEPGKESKESRAQKLADVIESGAVFFPENASWVEPLLALLTGFPTAEFDDPVDAIAQAVYRWSTRSSALSHLKRILGKPFS